MSAFGGSPSAKDLLEDASLQGTPDSSRQQFRRYRKRRSAAGLFDTPSKSPHSLIGSSSEVSPLWKQSSPQASLDAWQRREPSDEDLKTPKISRKLFPGAESGGLADLADGLNVPSSQDRSRGLEQQRRMTPRSAPAPNSSPFVLKAVKKEAEAEEESTDSAEESFGRFATIVDATLQGHLSFPELMLQCEGICRELADSVREEATDRHRVTEDRLMRQKAQMLHGEAASWALLWHLFGKGPEEIYMEDDDLSPSTSQQQACEFIAADQNAQLCLRIVQWLESLASKALDYEKKHKGWYAGSYGQKLGVWRHTQRAIRKKAGQGVLVQHLDPDAPTREQARLHSEDQKLEESLLEDVWNLLLAGRLEEAQELCRSAGQAWRAASLGGCGELGPSPSVEAWRSKGKDRSLLAVELESGPGHQRRLWKWACYHASEKIGGNADESKYEAAVFATQCGNVKRMLPVCYTWEAACWAMVRSWLDVQVDFELGRLHGLNLSEDRNGVSTTSGLGSAGSPDVWPQPVADQQPRDLYSLFQKLLSGRDLVHDNVRRSCNEQQRLIQMDLMLGDIGHLLDLLRTWISPPRDRVDSSRLHGHPQMIRFGAHLVLVLRNILADELKEHFREKLWFIGDLILNTYAIFLFTQRREDLVGVYASQLAPHLCVELYVHMMELRENESVPVKYKIFRSAMEYLPFFPESTKKGSFSDILTRVLDKSRDIRPGLQHPVKEEAAGGARHQTMQKAQAVQWLCFTPPAGLPNMDLLRAELLARALEYSNILFREFALISLWRSTEMPVGAHVLLGHLAEPLNQPTEALLALEQHRVPENLQEFEEWREYYACDALYRNWLKIEHVNREVPSEELSPEEKERAATAAQQALNAATSLLQRNHGMWMTGGDEVLEEPFVADWIELQCTSALASLSGSLVPDATVCTALTDALHYCGADYGVQRQLMVSVSINSKDGSLVDIVVRCLSVKGDGLGLNPDYDGGLLASIMAYAVKGELPHFRIGVVLEVLRLDTWYVDSEGIQKTPAVFIAQGLCRRCCLPELILRCMQVRAALASWREDAEEEGTFELLEMVASQEFELYRLFSQRQLQELLQFERSARIASMEYMEQQLQPS